MTSEAKGPQRTCIACRKSQSQGQLVRYVVGPAGEILVDYRHRLPGRGAYSCVDATCVKAAVTRKQFQRSFRGQCAEPSLESLLSGIKEALQQKIINLLGMARKSGRTISGSQAVLAALRQNDLVALVIMAEDISSGISEKVVQSASRYRIPSLNLLNKEELGHLLGKEERSVVAIERGSLADAILVEWHRYLQMVREN